MSFGKSLKPSEPQYLYLKNVENDGNKGQKCNRCMYMLVAGEVAPLPMSELIKSRLKVLTETDKAKPRVG